MVLTISLFIILLTNYIMNIEQEIFSLIANNKKKINSNLSKN